MSEKVLILYDVTERDQFTQLLMHFIHWTGEARCQERYQTFVTPQLLRDERDYSLFYAQHPPHSIPPMPEPHLIAFARTGFRYSPVPDHSTGNVIDRVLCLDCGAQVYSALSQSELQGQHSTGCWMLRESPTQNQHLDPSFTPDPFCVIRHQKA